MSEVKITLKDGSVKEVAAGITYGELAKELNQKLGKQALLAVVDGVNKDLTDTIEKMRWWNLSHRKAKRDCMPSGIRPPM